MARQTAAEIAQRNSEIVQTRLARPTMTWDDVAKLHDVSEKTARNAWKIWSDSNKADVSSIAGDHLGYVAEKMAAFQEARSELADVVKSADNDAAKVGAIKAIIDVHAREIDLLQKTGLLPQDLGVIRFQMNLSQMSEAVYEVIRLFVPAKDKKKADAHLVQALESRLPTQQRALTS